MRECGLINKYSLSKDKNLRLSKNFRLSEFACADKSDTVLVSEELVDILQKVRDHFGRAVIITSGYRTGSHNKRVGGVSNSRHLTGEAADFTVSGVSPARVGYFLESLGVNGIGIYMTSGFVHVDVREKGRWRGLIYGGREESLVKYFPTLSSGSQGGCVRLLQSLLKVDADGIFGPQTRGVLRKYQASKGLAVDGIAGKNTWRSLLGK